MNIICTKSKCLNNKGGKCIANEIYYDGLCQTYCTSQHASKQHAGICQRSHGRMKNKDNNICLLYTSPSPRDGATSRMPSSA